MPIGLINALEKVGCSIYNLFKDMLDSGIAAYPDDILM